MLMKCAACYNEMVKKKGEIDLRIGGKLYIVKNVSFEECPSCGERVLSPEISEILFEKIENKEFVEQMTHRAYLSPT
ncbi:MAG: YgiT-type zinc finger protein [Candidatus Hydrothermarchaeaceae archaeon]